jgi:hypothetical protein
MLIVGGGAALLAIAAWLVWLAVGSQRRKRRMERLLHAREYAYAEREHAQSSF